MSGKVQKQIRKLAKQELEKRMQPQRQQINIIAELQQFIASCELLTGEKPTSFSLTAPLYNLYVQTAQENAEVLGLNQGFRTEEPTFMGVKLIKKSPLIVPPSVNVPTPPTEPKTN